MFLQRVIADVLAYSPPTAAENLLFIVPSKRSIVFLKKYYTQATINKAGFAPKFISIEDFFEKVSKYRILPDLPLLFELYHTYVQCQEKNDKQADTFDEFLLWGQTILSDFNDIDQYLIHTPKLFPYLEAIKEVENLHWEGQPTTEIQQKYQEFWNSLETYYNAFTKKMESQMEGYQGFVSRKAVENLDTYIAKNKHIRHIFVGFNALSKTEETIIERILWEIPSSEIYWDIDKNLLEQGYQSGLFIKEYIKNWRRYKNKGEFKWQHQDFSAPKQIEIFGVPQGSNQAHLLAQIIENTSKNDLLKTAVVLADEALLIPILKSLNGQELEQQGILLNITMGYPLKNTLFSGVFGAFFKLYTQEKWYYKDVINLLIQPPLKKLFSKEYTEKTILHIYKKNYNYLSHNTLKLFTQNSDALLAQSIFLENKKPEASVLISACLKIIDLLKNSYEKEAEKNALELEYLYRFYQLFNQIQELQNKHGFITNAKSLYQLYGQLLLKQSLDFKGEPLEGLQLMGLMESRNLDFNRLIITSLNEGALPKGNSGNSFLPYDMRIHLKLPTYEKKDAIFAYHFFRLLQRAQYIQLIYNAEEDSLKNNEKSRFIEQLLALKDEKPFQNIQITQHLIVPKVRSVGLGQTLVQKTPYIMEKLKERAQTKGFSPTALSTYIRNPIEFYLQIIHGVKDDDLVEESISQRNFGTILHEVLENLYTEIGTPTTKEVFPRNITAANIKSISSKRIEQEIEKSFRKIYDTNIPISGKNYLIINILKDYIEQFLKLNAREINHCQKVTIYNLEETLSGEIDVNGMKIKLNGIADRIELRDNVLHIIDYKTGSMEQNDVVLYNTKWEQLTTNFNHSKAFQLLMYAYLIKQKNNFPNKSVIAGNYCFKNLSKFLAFSTKETKNDKNLTVGISLENLQTFEVKLTELLSEIFNPKIPFISKEIQKH